MAMICKNGAQECGGCGRCMTEPAEPRAYAQGRRDAVRVYEKMGANSESPIYGDAAALERAFQAYGIQPVQGFDKLHPEFVREIVPEILELFYGAGWVVWDSEEEYQAATGAA